MLSHFRNLSLSTVEEHVCPLEGTLGRTPEDYQQQVTCSLPTAERVERDPAEQVCNETTSQPGEKFFPAPWAETWVRA